MVELKNKMHESIMDIPTIDLSPFFKYGDEDGEKKAKDMIKEACSEYGFFQIENHGVPLDLLGCAMQLSKTFFALSDDEKLKYCPRPGTPLPAGYNKQPEHSPDKKEYLLMFQPECPFNILPTNNPPHFRDVLEEVFVYLRKIGEVIQKIVNECLGLPADFLKEYNADRSWDFMVALRYFRATGRDDTGITEHEDGNLITFVFQDDVGGLEAKKDGKWIPVTPSPHKIVVNIGDVLQVLTNKKFKSSTHRVVSKEKFRHSFAFFFTVEGDRWVEPLPQFTQEIGEPPKYRGFMYKDYQAMRLRNKTHPPSRPEDVITIAHYAIPT